mmetsp:Transcript_17025/g.49819  ORF Transcript_17025/g.49819 Transcript_17025/m.49819 type:complete len:229 (-) Transcript_17025:1515-2201(-)
MKMKRRRTLQRQPCCSWSSWVMTRISSPVPCHARCGTWAAMMFFSLASFVNSFMAAFMHGLIVRLAMKTKPFITTLPPPPPMPSRTESSNSSFISRFFEDFSPPGSSTASRKTAVKTKKPLMPMRPMATKALRLGLPSSMSSSCSMKMVTKRTVRPQPSSLSARPFCRSSKGWYMLWAAQKMPAMPRYMMSLARGSWKTSRKVTKYSRRMSNFFTTNSHQKVSGSRPL